MEKEETKNIWTAVRLSTQFHKKLSLLALHNKIKLSKMIEMLIEREYRESIEEIKDSL